MAGIRGPRRRCAPAASAGLDAAGDASLIYLDNSDRNSINFGHDNLRRSPDMGSAKRQLHFNAFLMSSGHHEAAWRLPQSDPFANFDLGHWRNLAHIAERGTFDSLFLADGPALWHSPAHRPAGALEPTVLLTALAMATSHIGLIATASTTYNEPYNLARRFASVDHVSGGRAGWNIVT